jgi:hypothetical protein
MGKYNMRWFKKKFLSPCGSLECLRLIIEYADFNPFHFRLATSSFSMTLKPIYIYLCDLYQNICTDLKIIIPADISLASQVERYGPYTDLF